MDIQALEKLENSLDAYHKAKQKAAAEICEVLKASSKDYRELEAKLAWYKASVYWSITNVNEYSPLFAEAHRIIEREKSKVPIHKKYKIVRL